MFCSFLQISCYPVLLFTVCSTVFLIYTCDLVCYFALPLIYSLLSFLLFSSKFSPYGLKGAFSSPILLCSPPPVLLFSVVLPLLLLSFVLPLLFFYYPLFPPSPILICSSPSPILLCSPPLVLLFSVVPTFSYSPLFPPSRILLYSPPSPILLCSLPFSYSPLFPPSPILRCSPPSPILFCNLLLFSSLLL